MTALFYKRGGSVPRNSVALHIVIEAPVPTQESVRSSIYVLGVTILPLSMVVILDFAIVPIVSLDFLYYLGFIFFNMSVLYVSYSIDALLALN
jgi:hypothetical protein